ncbi:MAG: hypothetical protein JOZ31_01700 [Verrucomicrobia bacterium]|nr:hypothetical protein [Verrucomicrobiota bacterium]MBV8486363.1 hypothetical protein [Verrucomicrobiota bacterium]
MPSLILKNRLIRDASVTITCLIVFLTLPLTLHADETIRDDRVGVCTHFSQNWSPELVIPLIAKSGVGWIRDDFNWSSLEPTPGNYHIPAETKSWIQAARTAGLKIDLILAYGNGAYADHYDTAAYAKAAGWLAHELANEVQAIEVLNEPNNFGFRDTYGGQWNGNERNGSVSPYLQKYVQILNAAAKEIKSTDAKMMVIGLGAPPPASFRMIALGLVPQVDGLTDHPYGRDIPEVVPYANNPYYLLRDGIATADGNGTFASQVSMFRAQAKKYGATEKLWDTEWGYSTERSKSGAPVMSEETQAVYILRRLLESEATGVEHTFAYDFKDDGADAYSHEQNFGLIHNDLSAKPAYFALQRVTKALAGMSPAARAKQATLEVDPAVKAGQLGSRCYTSSSSDGATTVVAFWDVKQLDPNAKPTNATIAVPVTGEARHVFLYDLLSDNQTEISDKVSQNVSNRDRRISVPVSLSAVPQLLIVR